MPGLLSTEHANNGVDRQDSSDAVPHQASTADRDGLCELNLKLVFRKISLRLLPTFFLLNMLNYLDRTNLAFASIQMSRDIGLSPKQYGVGSGLFFLGYSLFQLPSQLILRHIGAPVWLAIIVTAWGITACCMAAISGKASFYIVRLLLGITESGNFPGCWYYLTRFYPDKHITIPYSITDSAIMFAQVLGAPLAAGLLHLNGLGGLLGWQWLFLVEGVPTAVLGLCLPFLLPASPARARWLNGDEAAVAESEVHACRGATGLGDHSVASLLRTAFTNRHMYVLGIVKFTKDMTSYGTMFWAPLLIKGLLHHHKTGQDACGAWAGGGEASAETGYVAVLLTGIPYSLAALMNVVVAWNSQRTGDRRWHIAVCYVVGGLSFALLPVMNKASIVSGFIALTLVIVLSLCPNGCLLALASSAGQGPAMSLNLAVFNSIGNAAGMLGPLIVGVVLEETCSYDLAFILLGIVLIAGGVLALFVQDQAGKTKRGEGDAAAAAMLTPKAVTLMELTSVGDDALSHGWQPLGVAVEGEL